MATSSKKTFGSATAPKRSRAATKNITHEAIAHRAYEHFLARGMQHGRDMEDWLTAEKELRG
jgi:hypothetical protein